MDDVLSRDPGDRVQLLDADGRLVEPGYEPPLGDDGLVEMYRLMRLVRHFDERMVSLQRQGRIGTYSPAAGQEAAQVGTTFAFADDDPVFYQYREHAVPLGRGFPPEYVRYWMGHEEGNAALAELDIFPLNICIADHIPHATGMAWAAKLRDDDCAVACHFGDGATSEGDFHEGLNFAGVFDVPAVFVCHNNQWAISLPREEQTASETIAQKADAYGFDGIQVDGMDPLAVYEATRAARRKATDPDGDEPRPTLIEAVQYRFGAHTTADDPSVYRDEEEVDEWREKDPIPRLETFLRERGLLDDQRVESIVDSVEEEVAAAVDAAESAPDPDPDAMFADAYAEPTPRVQESREELARLRERHGDDVLTREE